MKLVFPICAIAGSTVIVSAPLQLLYTRSLPGSQNDIVQIQWPHLSMQPAAPARNRGLPGQITVTERSEQGESRLADQQLTVVSYVLFSGPSLMLRASRASRNRRGHRRSTISRRYRARGLSPAPPAMSR